MRGEDGVNRKKAREMGELWGHFAFRFILLAGHLCVQNEEYLQEFIQVASYLVTY